MVTYANTFCANCLAVHPVGDHIDENLETKRRTKEIVFHLSLIFNRMGGGRARPVGLAITNAEASRPLIVGVLTAGPRTYVARSGGPGAAPAFDEALRQVLQSLPTLQIAGPVVVPVLTRGGTAIGAANIAGCHVPGSNVPLQCAAPKLIDAANRDPLAVMPYHMSEVWFDAHNYERATAVTATRSEATIAGVFTDHGHTRLSCATCQNVVPILMCPQ